MRRFCLHLLIVLAVLFAGTAAWGQTVYVKASTDKSKILLGEPFWLTLEIKAPGNVSIIPFRLDSIPHFEFLKEDSLTKTTEGGVTLVRQYFQLTSFDSGTWVIPQISLRPNVKTQSILVDVVFTDPFDPNQPYHDIQDVRSVPFKLNSDFEQWWYAIAILLMLLALIIYWLTGEKKPRPAKPEKLQTPYEAALQSLKTLQDQGAEGRNLYAGLVDIFREYVRARTGIASLHQTSNDLVAKLQPLFNEAFDATKYKAITQVLVMSDFVKFAKYDPVLSETGSAREVVTASITHIEEEANRKGLPLQMVAVPAEPQ